MRLSLVCIALTVALAFAPFRAHAYEDGIGSTNCNASGCHGGGPGTTSVDIAFTSPLVVGQAATISVTVNNDGDWGAGAGVQPPPAAGFNLLLSAGNFAAPPGAGAQEFSAEEATHTTPRTTRSWSLSWTPTTSGAVSYTLWGNAVNFTGTPSGDRPVAGARTGSVTVVLSNGSGCSSGGQCASGHCTDGVCCNSSCGAACQACTPGAGGQSSAGNCSALVAGSGGCCSAGFYWNGSSCDEVDECDGANDCCAAGVSGCPVTATCVNTTGSYGCDCPVGYSGNGFDTSTGCTACAPGTTTFGSDQFCSNINECLTASCGNGACVEIALGSWVAPGFTCACDPGYEQSDEPGGRTCIDVDECARGFDDCTDAPAGRCTNSIGSFDCACETPAFVGATGRDCVDYDECMDTNYTNTCSTASYCVNGFGTWDCICLDGYEGDGFTCTDIDECDRDLDTCDVNATCANTIGAYTCTCNEHWEGSGFICSDVDECESGTGACVVGEVCVNEIGAANDCVCAPGYTQESVDAPCDVRCADGTRGLGEECDDANMAAGDGCSDRCDVETGWACREPVPFGTSTCNETCGDGLIDVMEECDDGAANSNTQVDACRTRCVDAYCGDGVADTGEGCDDGEVGNSDTEPGACRTSCDPAYCGDGVLDPGEVCDPGGGLPTAVVVGTCTTLCIPDAGIDPEDPPALTGGAGCACRAARAGGDEPVGWLGAAAALALALTRRRRRGPLARA